MADLIDGVPVSERSLYLTQIKYLEEQIEMCQQRHDGLETQNKDLTSQYDALKKNKDESIDHLKRLVQAKVRREAEYLQNLQLQHGLQMEDLQLQHDLQMQQLQQQLDALLSEGQRLATACLEQQELKEQRRQQILQQLDSENRRRRLAINVSELEAAIDGLKDAAETERKNAITAKKERIDRQVSWILRQERIEDAKWLERLHFLQSKNVALPSEMDDLRDQNQDLGLQRDRLKLDLRRLTKEWLTCKRGSKKTNMDCQQMEAELEARSSALRGLLAGIDSLRELAASATEESDQKAAEVTRLRAEIKEERRYRKGPEGVQWEAVILLNHILTDSEEASETEQKLQRLLEILESSAPQCPGSTPRV